MSKTSLRGSDTSLVSRNSENVGFVVTPDYSALCKQALNNCQDDLECRKQLVEEGLIIKKIYDPIEGNSDAIKLMDISMNIYYYQKIVDVYISNQAGYEACAGIK